MSVSHPIAAVIALTLAIGIGVAFRRIDRIAWRLLLIGAIFMSAAGGGLTVDRSRDARVVVMVDQSASTRTADYHNVDRLRERLHMLLPNQTPALVNFSEASAAATIWKPVDAEAILLFSDGQFAPPPTLPPTWVVVDPALEAPADASISGLRRDRDGDVEIDVKNSGDVRQLVVGTDRQAILRGGSVVTVRPPTFDTAMLSPGDAWPENDALPLPPMFDQALSRWWVGADPPAGWTKTDLPEELAAYASAAVIAVRGEVSLSTTQAEYLHRYVAELGGGLLLIDSNMLPDLSPLSYDAPTPQRRWIVLIDRSGSMATPLGNATRFAAACAAGHAVLARLPANDRVAIGGVARDLTWWIADASVADAATAAWPPVSAAPTGPTNVELILQQLLANASADLSTQIILLTDSDVPIRQARQLTESLAAHRVVLHLLSIDAPNATLVDIAKSSGGDCLTSDSSIDLLQHAEALAARAMPRVAKTTISFSPPFDLPPRMASDLRPTWLRDGAHELARANSRVAVAADWNRGVGKVLTCAFDPTSPELQAFEDAVARTPSDPRFQISINDGRRLIVDARDHDRHLNHLHLSLVLANQPSCPMTQIAPGQYAADVDRANQSRIAALSLDRVAVARCVIPAHYAAEFDAIGNNDATFQFIASRSAGGIVQPEQTTPLSLPRVHRRIALAAPLAAAAAACWLAALWRRKL